MGEVLAVRDKLPQLAVNEHSVLMLSPDESLQESHRHLAHAMAIHPLRLMDMEDERSRQIINATVHNLEVLGTGLWGSALRYGLMTFFAAGLWPMTFPWFARLGKKG